MKRSHPGVGLAIPPAARNRPKRCQRACPDHVCVGYTQDHPGLHPFCGVLLACLLGRGSPPAGAQRLVLQGLAEASVHRSADARGIAASPLQYLPWRPHSAVQASRKSVPGFRRLEAADYPGICRWLSRDMGPLVIPGYGAARCPKE